MNDSLGRLEVQILHLGGGLNRFGLCRCKIPLLLKQFFFDLGSGGAEFQKMGNHLRGSGAVAHLLFGNING